MDSSSCPCSSPISASLMPCSLQQGKAGQAGREGRDTGDCGVSEAGLAPAAAWQAGCPGAQQLERAAVRSLGSAHPRALSSGGSSGYVGV